MNKIKNIQFTDFKFFYEDFNLDIQRNNVLVYGENGSGKSSIYWGLHCFLNSSVKTPNEIQKYFDHSNSHNLINIYSSLDTDNSKIKVVFENGDKNENSYTISKSTQNTRTSQIKETLLSSDFLTYKIIFQIYNFKNSESIDLFPLWESDLLETIHFDFKLTKTDGTLGSNNAKEWWDYIKNGLNPRPKMNDPKYIAFKKAEEDFNTSFSKYINSIIENTNGFIEKFEQKFRVSLNYTPCVYDGFVKDSTTKRTHIMVPPKLILKVEHLSSNIVESKRILLKPHTFLNEARLATIALSIRFAMLKERLNTTSACKLLVIDDLLLSLDMSNRELVLKILFSEFSDYQMIMLTHDRHFYEFTKHNIKRFSASDWLYWEMYERRKDGIPQPHKRDSKSYIENAEYYCEKNEYDIAGNFLRKEAECFLKDFLPKRYKYTKDYALCDLNGLIGNATTFAEQNHLDSSLFTQLDSFRKFVLNPTSHDSYDVPKYKSEIVSCINTLKELHKIQFEPIFKQGDKLDFELTDQKGDIYSFEIRIEDDFKLIKEQGKESIISKGMINYYIKKNGVILKERELDEELRHSKESIKQFYKTNYEKSDKTKTSDFWDGIMYNKTDNTIRTLKRF